jgi:cell division protease FtsH
MPELRCARSRLDKLKLWGLVGSSVLLIGLLGYGFISPTLMPGGTDAQARPGRLTYSRFLDRVEEGEVRSATLQGDTITATLLNGKGVVVTAPHDPELIKTLRAARVDVRVAASSGIAVGDVLGHLVLLAILGLVIYQLVASRKQQQLAQGGDMAQSRAQRVNGATLGVRFSDVAGIDEVRDQVEEITAYLRDPGRFRA